ncbi:ester cyclase [Actinophytocola sp. KF-1]
MADHKEIVTRIVDEVVNRGDYAPVRELFSPDFAIHKAGMSFPPGPEAFKMAVREWRDAFPDYRVTVVQLIAEDDHVTVLYTAEGTHTGSLRGMPPTGKAFTYTGAEVHRFAGGLVVESWLADDLPRILTDTGLMAPASSGNQWS